MREARKVFDELSPETLIQAGARANYKWTFAHSPTKTSSP